MRLRNYGMGERVYFFQCFYTNGVGMKKGEFYCVSLLVCIHFLLPHTPKFFIISCHASPKCPES